MSIFSNPGKVGKNLAKKAKKSIAAAGIAAPVLDAFAPGAGTALGTALAAGTAGIGDKAKRKKQAKAAAPVPVAEPQGVSAPTPAESVAADFALPAWAMPAILAALAVLVLGGVYWLAKK